MPKEAKFLIDLQHLLKSSQAQNEVKYDSALKLYSSTQAERIEKFNSIEKGQAEVIDLLSSLKKTNDLIQERLKNLEIYEGATIEKKESIIPPPFKEIKKAESLEQKVGQWQNEGYLLHDGS